MSRQQELALKRTDLLARSSALRRELADHGAHIESRLQLVDRGLRFAKAATERPLLTAVAGALLMLFKPTRALKWIARGAVVTSLLRRLLAFVELSR